MSKYIDFALVGELVVHGDVHYEDLMRIPAADVVEVRHGKWIELYENNYKCSVCGSWWTCEETPIESGLLYCPNCGSRMDLEDEVEE